MADFTSTFTKIADMPRTYGAVRRVSFVDAFGRGRTLDVALRIDGREGDYRVDTCTMPPIWEAIDGGTGFRTLAQAKRFVSSWCHEANHQRTLSPRQVIRPDERLNAVVA